VRGNVNCEVAVSVNAGRTWSVSKGSANHHDLTDIVKGRSQYWIRFAAGADQLMRSRLQMRTVCQASVAVLPRLKENGTVIQYEVSRKAAFSMGPELDLSQTFVVEGAFGERTVTLAATQNRPTVGVYAAAHVASGSPPDPNVRYKIDVSLDAGETWQPVVRDWSIPRRGDEPDDFWSQSFCYGSAPIRSDGGGPIWVRFSNDGGKRYLRAEAHLIYQTGEPDPIEVTYNWADDDGNHRQSHVFTSNGAWKLATGQHVRTRWVELTPVF
jgi:hypothetical protein